MLLLALAGCHTDLPEHTLAFGGDVMLGRQLNEALVDPQARERVLGGIEILRTADLTVVNGEGVIASGGSFVAKGEDGPNTWRVRPEGAAWLALVGVDVVALGNNHAGDYGPEGIRETILHLRAAGLDGAGAGLDDRDARQPVYRTVGDTVLAIVGVDLTGVRAYRAYPDRPGSLSFQAERPDDTESIVRELDAIEDEARRYADLVLLTPHWGPNWRTEPHPAIRALAPRLIAAGYDGILGHSAHTLQGVELVDGKPVIYDAGNLTIPYDKDDPAHRAMVYALRFTRAGITGITAYPLALTKNRTVLAAGAKARRILGEWDQRTTALGTRFAIDGTARTISCDPGAASGPWIRRAPPVRTTSDVPPPTRHTVDALPATATPADVAWDGVRLVGWELLVPTIGRKRAAQVVTLYLVADAPQHARREITLRAFNDRGHEDESHWPADWALTPEEWPTGEILVDRTLYSFQLEPEPEVRFGVSLGTPPVASDLPVVDGFVVLGAARYDAAAPSINDILPRPDRR